MRSASLGLRNIVLRGELRRWPGRSGVGGRERLRRPYTQGQRDALALICWVSDIVEDKKLVTIKPYPPNRQYSVRELTPVDC